MTSKITIITAVFNGGATLGRLINSIIPQKGSNIEFILIDGGSKDNTLDIIKANENIIDYWISEPDKGIYDAWNKGIKKASGNWIMFLGCDDLLMPDAIQTYTEFIHNNSDNRHLEYISSRIEIIDKKGNTVRIKGWKWEWPKFLREVTVAHPGSLHARSFFEKYGDFDITYKITGDFELLLRPRQNFKTAYINKVTAKMTEGGASDSVKAIIEHYKAATITGGSSKLIAYMNMMNVYIKFKAKKIARSIGLNLYLKR